MWTPVELPYFRDTYGLPAPLPTTDEIMASMTLLKDRLGQKMLRVGQHFVVKYGQDTSEVEGHNLLFVEHNLHNIVCAPRLYAMYRDADDRLFLIMKFLEGEYLDGLWKALSDDEKSHIMSRLKDMFAGCTLYLRLVSTAALTKAPANSVAFIPTTKKYSYKSDFYERHLSRVLSGHRPFSHSENYRKNIMIHKTNKHTPEKCDYIVALVDWEYAGWYPSYWDYAISFTHFHWDDDWPERFESFLEPWPAEAALVRMFYQEIFF
ncbi:hypothetical protein H112_01468 [Trichophyton rubrum D6]|uniref:Aminoglycoside phosphotransferase domain-containing protein n=3 Tax=Trichophyton TaxID=5550 RepID=F2SX13_TRIRC|nr:uncharacterized protein TERG_07109 [Trichophyton rubrum CBS 118892]EZF26401.1 hypothetical protein H100_01463 [Trichophyton rubrum MR850]EZF45430.1 hypothetical protein H102_01458 [Trichophyton rubrum CBS 100081]EZF56030.1 hypothetical protein H103_01472 [Trichophyton rubrum CBS 288.86]EZF66702.1 hypothetical protein H104_01448 [Trichophyton rubrum CBS 289.86]EZF77478.1 hypothetical protein H105_01475 [Trichophyton soudanense CBS 452.61]EZF87990.1 hypothetical protein H110_01467 [Trichophy